MSALEKDNKKEKNYSEIAFTCALIPILLIISCYTSDAKIENSSPFNGFVWLFLIAYYFTAGLPIFIVALINGIKGLKTDKRRLAIVRLFLIPIPIIFFALIHITGIQKII